MAGGAGVAAPDGMEAGAAVRAQLVAADRGVVGIAPAQPDMGVNGKDHEIGRCRRDRQRRRPQR